MSVTNLAGLPAGVLMVVLAVTGGAPPFSPALSALVAFNLASWIYYAVRSYGAAWDAVPVTGRERLGYLLVSNPFTQLFYSTVWALPIFLAAADAVRGRAPEFAVTPKRTSRERKRKSAETTTDAGDG